jgi:carbonic anhydrase/acetyltransferase-like protein (isoleucine patch superfamily)
MSRSTSLLWRGLRNPGRALQAVLILARAWRYKAWCRLRGIRLQTGRNFRISGRLIIRGPGRVVFGDNVLIDGVVTPWTYSADAVISVGSDSYVNGTRFGCQREIRIGERAILGDARILDTDFHSTLRNRHDPEAPIRVAPVHIEENVWVAAAVGILPGTRIGRNSVVGFGAVCAGSYPADVIIAGNPAVVVRSIPADGEPARDETVRGGKM